MAVRLGAISSPFPQRVSFQLGAELHLLLLQQESPPFQDRSALQKDAPTAHVRRLFVDWTESEGFSSSLGVTGG